MFFRLFLFYAAASSRLLHAALRPDPKAAPLLVPVSEEFRVPKRVANAPPTWAGRPKNKTNDCVLDESSGAGLGRTGITAFRVITSGTEGSGRVPETTDDARLHGVRGARQYGL